MKFAVVHSAPALWPTSSLAALPCPRASISLSATVNDERRLLRGDAAECGALLAKLRERYGDDSSGA